MQHVRFGRTGLKVSRACLGTMTFGLQCDEATSFAILDRAAEAGVNFIDTADAYPLGGDASTAGRTEAVLGKWLAGKRHDFVVATKVSGRVGPNPWDAGLSRKHVLDAIDASLVRLGTDYVDLYQLHHADPDTPMEETLDAMHDVVTAGKARYVGVSNHRAWEIALALGISDAAGKARFVSVQPRYSLLFREMERELFPLCAHQGLAVMPYNPLAGGLLSGKHALDRRPPNDSRFTLGSAAENYQSRYWHQREFETVARIGEVADGLGVSMVTLSVAWVLANPVITTPILGASRPEQLDASLAAFELELELDAKRELDDLSAEYRLGDAYR